LFLAANPVGLFELGCAPVIHGQMLLPASPAQFVLALIAFEELVWLK
jgi:hypothetical protein